MRDAVEVETEQGKLIQQFPLMSMGWRIVAIFGAANLAVLFVLVTSVQEPISQGKSISILAYVVLAILVVSWLYANYYAVKRYQNRWIAVNLYENALSIQHGNNERIMLFSEMRGVSWNFYQITNASASKVKKVVTEFRVELLTDEKITLRDDQLPSLEELGNLLDAMLASYYLEEVVSKLQAGERVSFGLVEIDQDGLYFEEYMLWWSGLSQFTLQDGNLVVLDKEKDPVALLPLNQIYNVQLLGTIGEELMETTEELEEVEASLD
ncbi:DUF6585 family protein [Risungbinella massiliensis]|uniref:DUF6585 family protein n=1 Tax=Risungbinella massiliensis TaxID=1329796 RepID=UPI0005CC8D3C|nr:DUF6585 family protein [Risungbinella massiliensis]